MSRVLWLLAAWVAMGGLGGWALGRWLVKRDRRDSARRQREEPEQGPEPEPPAEG